MFYAGKSHDDLLTGLLKRLSDEVAALSKKQPDVLINAFKVGQINRVLIPLKEMRRVSYEISCAFSLPCVLFRTYSHKILYFL